MKIAESALILREAVETFRPTHIVSMVSGGKDSAASDQVARDLGVKIDLVIHGNTRCGIPETSDFVRQTYGALGDYAEADAGTKYEEYCFRKGFFGKGISSHAVAYHILKRDPFYATISKLIRKRKRGVRVLLLTGARKDETENRRKHLTKMRPDPRHPSNIWVPITFDWSQEDRDAYLKERGTPINPVATQLCRSGECMCGTMQSHAERAEAAALYPKWGQWLKDLEDQVKAKHGFGWGERPPKNKFCTSQGQGDMFQPMCKDCIKGNTNGR